MNQEVIATVPQHHFGFLDELEPPTFAPLDDVVRFEDEVDAINFAVDQTIRHRRGVTHMQLADDMKITRAVMSKLRQGQVAMPVNKFLSFIEATRSYALLQFYALRLGLVVKPREQEAHDKRELERLKAKLEDVEARYKRVVGE